MLETIGIVLEAKYSGVMVIPSIISIAPPTPKTTGTLRAVNPKEARFGQGRASIRGMDGKSKMPNGQISHEDGNKPNANKAMVKSGTGRRCPLRTP